MNVVNVVNVLIVRVSSLGDVVHNMPMVADLLRHHPQMNIDWVVEEAYADLVRLNPGVRHVIPFALRRWRKNLFSSDTHAEIRAFCRSLRKETYDIVFDTQGLIKTGAVMGIALLAKGGKRVGLANATEGSGYEGISRIFHTMSVPVERHTHAVQRGRIVAAAALGYALDSTADFHLQPPALRPSWLPNRPYAVFFHGTARAAKQWPIVNWIAVAHWLAEQNLPVLLPWGNVEEKHTAEQVALHLRNAQVLPKLPMLEAVVLAQQAALAIGVDTGLTHLAAAFNRPTIELYCDSPRWKTEGNWSANIINLGDLGQPPGIEEVKNAAARLLAQNQ